MEFLAFQSRNFDVHGKTDFTRLSVNRFQIATTATNNSTCLLILEEICREMTILQQVEVVVIFMPYFRSIATHTVCGYCTNMKLI